MNKYEYMWKKLKKSLEEMIDSDYSENKEIFEIMLRFMIAEDCDSEEMKNKYMNVSNTLYELFMVEHGNIGKMFKNE